MDRKTTAIRKQVDTFISSPSSTGLSSFPSPLCQSLEFLPHTVLYGVVTRHRGNSFVRRGQQIYLQIRYFTDVYLMFIGPCIILRAEE